MLNGARLLLLFSLICSLSCLSAQFIWHRPDSLIALPHTEAISSTDSYIVIAVLRNVEPDSTQLLWGIKENDTLQAAFLTNANYSITGGVRMMDRPHNYSHWSICYYQTGCRMDTACSYALCLGETPYSYTDSLPHFGSFSADVAIKELIYSSNRMTSVEAESWQTYLALKYGITLDYAPYFTPIGDTIWSPAEDEAFYHRIVGIGTDSLHQWAAACSNSYEMATMQIVAHESLDEGEYILLGDDDEVEEWYLHASGYNRMFRTWRMRTHLREDKTCSLVWRPWAAIANPDSVWMVLSYPDGQEFARHQADSVQGDSVWWFTCPSIHPIMHVSLETLADNHAAPSHSQPAYNASTGTISIPTLDLNTEYSYALYTHAGQLLYFPAPSYPDRINVGHLPRGLYRLEAYENGQIAASVPVIVQ